MGQLHYTYALLGLALLEAVGLGVYGALQRRELPVAQSIVVAFGLLGMALIPRPWLDPVVATLIALFAFIVPNALFYRLLAAGVTGGLCCLLFRVAPGGAPVAVLVVTLIIIAAKSPAAVRHGRRLARARALDPGRPAEGLVEIGGRAEGSVHPPPGLDAHVAAWWTTLPGGELLVRPPLLSVRTEVGIVLVDLQAVELDVDDERSRVADETQTAALLADHSPAAAKAPDGAAEASDYRAQLRWLPTDHPVHVIGIPSWEPDPTGSGGYRGLSGPVPVFRSRSSGEPARLVDRPEAEEIARSRWVLVRLLCWGLLAVGCMVPHLGGALRWLRLVR